MAKKPLNGKAPRAKRDVIAPLVNEAAKVSPSDRAAIHELVGNAVMSRSTLIKQYMDPRRDINQECGYPETNEIGVSLYREMYDREPVATRVVQVLPLETWQVQPTIYECEDSDNVTPFEQAWDDLAKSLRGNSFYQDEQGSPIWEQLKRADILSGIGHFGLILLGIDDGKALHEPIEGFEKGIPTGSDAQYNDVSYLGITAALNALPERKEEDDDEEDSGVPKREVEDDPKPKGEGDEESSETPIEGEQVEAEQVETKRKLLFLRCLDESLIQVVQYETDPRNPRFGQPIKYNITLNDPTQSHSGIGLPLATVAVHWSRVVHIADNLGSSEIFGVPRQRPVWNRLLDLKKLYGGSAEMYWRGAFPGLSFESHPQLAGDITIPIADVQDAAERYMNSLQRYLVTEGMTVKSIAPQVVDPTPQIGGQIEAICILIGVPQRIFMGSERGELASGQDDGTWNDRLREREGNYVTPRIVVPFVDRLIQIGVLPPPDEGYSVSWPDRDSTDELTQAQVAAAKTTALQGYVAGGVDALIAPMDYLTYVLGFSEEEAKAILDNSVSRMNEEDAATDPLLAKQEADKEHEMEQAELAHEQGLEAQDKDIQGKKEIEKAKPKPKATRNSRRLLQRLTSNSGDNCGTGAGGFREGNDCAKGGRAQAVKAEILEAASRVEFSEDEYQPPIDIGSLETWEIQEYMDSADERALEEMLEETARESMADWVNERLEQYDPQIDREQVWEHADATRAAIYDKMRELIEMRASSEAAGRKLQEQLDNWYHNRHTVGGEQGVELARDALSGLEDESELLDAIENYRAEVYDAVNEANDSMVEMAREEYENELYQDHASDFSDEDMRSDWIQQWAVDNKDKIREAHPGQMRLGVWQTDDEGDGVYHFQTSAGELYRITAVESQPGSISKVGDKQAEIIFAKVDGNRENFGVTGTGKAHEVFSNVVPSVIAYIQKNDLDVVTFSAAEKSRQRLYDRLVKSTSAILGDRFAAATSPGKGRYYLVGKREQKEGILAKAKASMSRTMPNGDVGEPDVDFLVNQKGFVEGVSWPSSWNPRLVMNLRRRRNHVIVNGLRIAVNFDPNQPRDEKGQWTFQGALEGLREKIAAAAQEEYDAWSQDEDGIDEVVGSGGICDQVSCRISDIVVGSVEGDVKVFDGGQDGDDHAFPVFKLGDKAYGVDIPPGVYETGGGYSWKKIPGVTIKPEDIDIFEIDASGLGDDDY